ncbi:hypothetical protein KOW79_001716 [Hemibagrus wyckioides]|uniref:Uncharacterized protein n=1 Tax=Hemibagrus wyckioides TaxID=337641 RepID=A0A9D3SU79_9TELE|nr:hypothetical protein KOW79_001716 [Hemibagrus wyckioides]
MLWSTVIASICTLENIGTDELQRAQTSVNEVSAPNGPEEVSKSDFMKETGVVLKTTGAESIACCALR